jgi:hypothetical protein
LYKNDLGDNHQHLTKIQVCGENFTFRKHENFLLKSNIECSISAGINIPYATINSYIPFQRRNANYSDRKSFPGRLLNNDNYISKVHTYETRASFRPITAPNIFVYIIDSTINKNCKIVHIGMKLVFCYYIVEEIF